MKITFPRLATIVATTVAVGTTAAIGAPGTAAAAASDIPAAPKGVVVTHEGWDAYIQRQWVSGLDHYDVTVSGAGKVQTYQLPANPAVPGQAPPTPKVRLDPCVNYIVSLGARNAAGQGGTTRVSAPSHFPGGILAASARRVDATTATFSWNPPQIRGTKYPTYSTEVTKLGYILNLVRMRDNKVITSLRPNWDWETARQNYTFYNLEKGAYVLKVETYNFYGSCAGKTGRILLKATK
ncbi:hypothetical protein [Krasilnikovia sp. M28-CT-15]|uniref:hypothetical protein n=1 Tax=Krasilnikovia sp. M28-CT-15 TaxID=3373540 RepID=UPI0038763726